MCRPVGSLLSVHPVHPVHCGVRVDVRQDDVRCLCCPGAESLASGLVGMRRVRVKKLLHFVKNLRRGATSKPIDEKPWWKMLALHSGMERLRLEAGVGAGRPERQSAHAAHARRAVDCAVDRAVRLAAVSTDLQLDLPTTIALPDGEEYPYGASARLHIRDPEQESEIYQKCIRPPPNRTVFDGESPPPYRSSSTSTSLGSGGSGGSGSALLRHGPHSAHHAAHLGSALGSVGHGLPAVIVPSPARKQDAVAAPALFLAGAACPPCPPPAAKHSTGAVPPPPPGSTAAGLVRLLSPSPSAERVLTVKAGASGARAQGPVCRTAHSAAHSAPSANLTASSASTSSSVTDIPAAPQCGSHLAGLTMVPCLAEARASDRTSATSCTSAASPAAPAASPAASPASHSQNSASASGQSPARTRTRPGEEPLPLARPLPRPPV